MVDKKPLKKVKRNYEPISKSDYEAIKREGFLECLEEIEKKNICGCEDKLIVVFKKDFEELKERVRK